MRSSCQDASCLWHSCRNVSAGGQGTSEHTAETLVRTVLVTHTQERDLKLYKYRARLQEQPARCTARSTDTHKGTPRTHPTVWLNPAK